MIEFRRLFSRTRGVTLTVCCLLLARADGVEAAPQLSPQVSTRVQQVAVVYDFEAECANGPSSQMIDTLRKLGALDVKGVGRLIRGKATANVLLALSKTTGVSAIWMRNETTSVNPFLRQKLTANSQLELVQWEKAGADQGQSVRLAVKLTDVSAEAQRRLTAAGFRLSSMHGPIANGSALVKDIARLAALPVVTAIEFSQPLYPAK